MCNSANFENIGVWLFANIFSFIVELNCKIKIGDKLKTKENLGSKTTPYGRKVTTAKEQ
jgi:hypothetical protein